MDSLFVDYYDFFGILPESSLEEIQTSYQRMLNHLQFVLESPMYSQKEWERLRKQFQIAKEGYEVLTHPNLKKSYDREYQKYKKAKDEEQSRGMDLRIGGSIQKSDFQPRKKYLYTAPPRKDKKIYWDDIKDSIKNFTIYNKRLLASVLAGGVIFSSAAVAAMNKNKMHFDYPPSSFSQETPIEEEIQEEIIPKKVLSINEPSIMMMRDYTVHRGDNLTRLAYNANSSVAVLKSINHLKKDVIYIGSPMKIPYTIPKEEISYYTDTIKLNGNESLEGIASRYYTDVDTICRLNMDSIVRLGEEVVFLDDYLIVPKFLSKSDLVEAQREEHFKNR